MLNAILGSGTKKTTQVNKVNAVFINGNKCISILHKRHPSEKHAYSITHCYELVRIMEAVSGRLIGIDLFLAGGDRSFLYTKVR